MDDLTGVTPELGQANESLAAPPPTAAFRAVSRARADSNEIAWTRSALLSAADDRELDYVTYAGARPRPAHAGMALALTTPTIRRLVRPARPVRRARRPPDLFITEWDTIGDPQRAELRELYEAGHDVERTPSITSTRRPTSRERLDAYLADEVLPSIEQLRAAGIRHDASRSPTARRRPR